MSAFGEERESGESGEGESVGGTVGWVAVVGAGEGEGVGGAIGGIATVGVGEGEAQRVVLATGDETLVVVVGEAQDVTAVCHAVEGEVVVLCAAREEYGDVVEIGVAWLGFAGLPDRGGFDGVEVGS